MQCVKGYVTSEDNISCIEVDGLNIGVIIGIVVGVVIVVLIVVGIVIVWYKKKKP